MGKIVIDVPVRQNRRYLIEDEGHAKLLLKALEISAIRVKDSPASVAELEDLADLKLVKTSVNEFRRTRKVRSWKEVKADLGL